MAMECIGDVGIEVPPAACFDTAADLERWTEWARDPERVEVLDRADGSRPTRVRMVADLFGKAFDAIVEFHHDTAPAGLRFSPVEARTLSSLDGSHPSAAGPGA